MYSTKEIAEKLGVSYDHFRHNRELYEKYMCNFFDYKIITRGNGGIYYDIIEQFAEYIPYKEYSNEKRRKIFQHQIKSTIAQDPRQTGSNIARIIFVNGEIQALNLALSTTTNYTRMYLKELVDNHYYVKTDYKWCCLDKRKNEYIEMTEKEVVELRKMFNFEGLTEQVETACAEAIQEKSITQQEVFEKIAQESKKRFLAGIQKFDDLYDKYPMKVPIYVHPAFYEEGQR